MGHSSSGTVLALHAQALGSTYSGGEGVVTDCTILWLVDEMLLCTQLAGKGNTAS
jgi:hypothetical protein